MCLAIPMQILRIDGRDALCSANGIERRVSLFLLPPDSATAGDFVIVHVGYAIQKILPEDAESTWGMIDAMSAMEKRNA